MSAYSAIIIGTGSSLPEKRLTNDDLSKMVDTNDAWITQRTGIKERRLVAPGETTAALATNAAKRVFVGSTRMRRQKDSALRACSPSRATTRSFTTATAAERRYTHTSSPRSSRSSARRS